MDLTAILLDIALVVNASSDVMAANKLTVIILMTRHEKTDLKATMGGPLRCFDTVTLTIN